MTALLGITSVAAPTVFTASTVSADTDSMSIERTDTERYNLWLPNHHL